MRMSSIGLLCGLVFGAAFGAGCSPYSPDLGAAPFLCGTEDPKCPDGYSCVTDNMNRSVCIVINGQLPDAGACPDQSLEPNDTIAQAYQLPLDSGGTKHTFKFAQLAICTAGDKDTYSITLTTDKVIESVLTYTAGGGVLSMVLLSGSGAMLGSSSPNGTNGARLYVANLPAAVYYVQVIGPAAGASLTNNYDITFNTCATTSDTLCQM
jgi:hypothetical protein